MKKMKAGDYILTKDIPDQETLDSIRDCVKKMGYKVSERYGKHYCKSVMAKCLQLHRDGDLFFTNIPLGDNQYTPQEIFAMVEEPNMKEDIKQTIDRMKQEIATLEEQLKESEKKVTYKRGDRFYIGSDDDVEEYILACVGGGYGVVEACLVGLACGNRWENHHVVNDAQSVTHKEMLTLTAGHTFRLIEK